jgi:hypothetical protein
MVVRRTLAVASIGPEDIQVGNPADPPCVECLAEL